MTPIVSSTLLRTQSDARLVALAGQGYERAFEAIVERYRKPLMRYCRRILPEARAEDAVQQTFIKAWSALGEGAEVHDLKPWLYRVSRNTALDAAKRAGFDYDELSESVTVTPAPEADVERRTVIRETLAGVAALPTNQREALLRTAVGGESRAVVARDMGLTDGAVRQLVHRARTTLRAAAAAITPMPVVTWAAGFGATSAPVADRVGELVAGAGSAGGIGLLLKAGTVVVAAGVIAVGSGATLRQVTGASADHAATAGDASAATPATAHLDRGLNAVGHSEQSAGDSRGGDHGRGKAGGGNETRHGGSGFSGDHGSSGDHHGSGTSGDRSGDHSGSGTSGDRSGDHSGSGTSGDRSGDHSGSGDSGTGGSGDSGGGSGTSASSGSGDSGTSGSGSSGSGDSGTSGSGDSATSRSGDSGTSGSSGSSGSGSVALH